jgi:ABC-2 type transport system permease protein
VALYWRLLSVHVRGQMQYRASFLLDAATTALVSVGYFVTLAAVFSRFEQVGGWRLGEIAFLFGLVEASFGLMDMVFSGYDPDIFSQHVRRGTFDLFLLRPLGLPLQVFTSEFALRRVGRIVQGLAVLALGIGLSGTQWTLIKTLYLPVVMASTVAFFGGLFVVGSTICFWTVQSVEVMNVFTYGGSEMLSYPMHIYADWLRRFFTYVLPAAVVVYHPALFFLDKPDPLGFPAWLPFASPLAGVAVLAGAFAFWRVGVRRYTSTGT